MPKGDLIAAQFFRHIVQCTLTHFCAEGAGIFLFSFLKNDLTDICIHNGIVDAQFITKGLNIIIFRAGQAQGNGDGFDLKFLGIEAFQSVECQKQADAVLAAGNTHGDLIAFFYHMIIIYGTTHVAEQFL